MEDSGSAIVSDNQPLKYVVQIANVLQTSDNAVRIVFSLVLGYPLAFLYRQFFLRRDPFVHHLFFTLCGLSLCYFNFGWNTIHSVANILLIYILLLAAGGTKASVVLAFLINMGYLCLGYYWTMSGSYTIKWTTPHCVLCLRLIGLVFDVYDGTLDESNLSQECKESQLKRSPSLLEICGYTFFFGGFLVGPQFSMRRYLDFVEGKYLPQGGAGPNSVGASMKKLAAGSICLSVFLAFSQHFPDSRFLEPEFLASPIWNIFLFVVCWSKIMLYKYVGCWLITEGACILAGLTYNGIDKKEQTRWDGCANIKLWEYEKASTCQHLVSTFNINTNKWMGKYVFKRLKFLGNKDVSQVATLIFLALWHGLYSGYFANFLLEFFLVKFERDLPSLSVTKKVVGAIGHIPGGGLAIWVVKKIHLQFILGYSLVSFCLFTFGRYMPVYQSLYFFVHIFYVLLWPLLFYSVGLKRTSISFANSEGSSKSE